MRKVQLGGYHLLAQTDARCPAGQVMGHHLHRQPGAVGGEAARRQMVQPDAVLEVADGILDLGVAAMVGLQFQGVAVSVGDETVIAVVDEEGQLGTGRGLHPPDDAPHRRGVGRALEGGVSGLSHSGGAVHPVGDGRPVLLRYRLDEIAQAGVLADGDGEADIQLAAGGDDGVGIEAAVGPHRELPTGTGAAYPTHRLPQEVGSAPSGVGPALAQPGHQHVAGASGHGQQRVIAPLAGVAMVSRPFLGQPMGLADGGVQVDGQRPVAGSGPCGPGPSQQLPAHPIQLADVAPPKTAQERPQGGWRLDHTAQNPGRPASPQRVGVVDAVSPDQGGGHQRHHLVARIGAARGAAQVQGQGGRKDQPSIGHQAVVVEGDLDAVGVVAWQHLLGAPGLGTVWCYQNHYPSSTGALPCPFSTLRHSSFRWIGANAQPPLVLSPERGMRTLSFACAYVLRFSYSVGAANGILPCQMARGT